MKTIEADEVLDLLITNYPQIETLDEYRSERLKKAVAEIAFQISSVTD